MDMILLTEVAIVALIILFQIVIFLWNNTSIFKLRKLYPPARALILDGPLEYEGAAHQDRPLYLLAENGHYSATFREIVHHTNAYLQKHPGNADLDIVKDIAQAKDASLENSIETNLPTPLYIGLLSTFAGVIIGLVRIAMSGVTDQAIQYFIGGVLIGMVGSAMGLGLTIASNYLFKEAKKRRDANLYDYLGFMRSHLVSAQTPASSVKEPAELPAPTQLRESLGAFHESFTDYQKSVNASLQETIKLTDSLKDSFGRLRSIETSLLSISGMLQQNDKLIDKLAAHAISYAQQADVFAGVIGDHLGNTERKLVTTIDDSVQKLDNSMRAAYVKMDQYLSSMDRTAAQEFTDSVLTDIKELKEELNHIQNKQLDTSNKLIEVVQRDDDANARLAEQVELLNRNLTNALEEQQERASILASPAFRIFIYAGSVMFMVGVLYMLTYIVNSARS